MAKVIRGGEWATERAEAEANARGLHHESCVECGAEFDVMDKALTEDGLCSDCYSPKDDPSHPSNMRAWHHGRVL